MEETNEFDDLVNFTLKKFGVKATYQVIYVTSEEWASYHVGYEIYRSFLGYELEWFNEFIKEEDPDLYKKVIERENKTADDNQIEYGSEADLNELLTGPAGLNIKLIEVHDFNKIVTLKSIENEIETFLTIQRLKSKGIEFVILLKKEKLLSCIKDSKLEVVAHESYHIIESIKDQHHANSFVNARAREIVREFKTNK